MYYHVSSKWGKKMAELTVTLERNGNLILINEIRNINFIRFKITQRYITSAAFRSPLKESSSVISKSREYAINSFIKKIYYGRKLNDIIKPTRADGVKSGMHSSTFERWRFIWASTIPL